MPKIDIFRINVISCLRPSLEAPVLFRSAGQMFMSDEGS